MGLRHGCHRVGRQQPPVDRGHPRRRVDLLDLDQLQRHRFRQSGGGTMARPADLHRTVFKRQPGAPRGQRRSCRRENLFRHHRPVGKKPPERHRAGPVAPQTVHDRALLFHNSPGQKPPLFARRLSPKRPANRSMNETIFTPSTNQSQMTENHLRKPSKIKTTQPQRKCVRMLAPEGRRRI